MHLHQVGRARRGFSSFSLFSALPISRKNVNAAFTGRLIGGWIASFVVTYDVRRTKKNSRENQMHESHKKHSKRIPVTTYINVMQIYLRNVAKRIECINVNVQSI